MWSAVVIIIFFQNYHWFHTANLTNVEFDIYATLLVRLFDVVAPLVWEKLMGKVNLFPIT